jgi:lipid II:glycine glycyltransferase (peptidoglycan interpeptide bridge formation enzyme)
LAINKARRLGVEVRVSHSRADLAAFYRLHWQTRRRLGVPVQPRRFFEAVWSRVIERDLGFVAIASRAGKAIAAALFLAWNRQLIYKFGASDRRHWELRPNNLVMWSAIEWACARGYRLLDFGKTELDNQGLRTFKDRWGSIESPLFYSYSSSQPRPASQTLPMAMASQLIRWSPPIVCRAAGELLYGRSA